MLSRTSIQNVMLEKKACPDSVVSLMSSNSFQTTAKKAHSLTLCLFADFCWIIWSLRRCNIAVQYQATWGETGCLPYWRHLLYMHAGRKNIILYHDGLQRLLKAGYGLHLDFRREKVNILVGRCEDSNGLVRVRAQAQSQTVCCQAVNQ